MQSAVLATTNVAREKSPLYIRRIRARGRAPHVHQPRRRPSVASANQCTARGHAIRAGPGVTASDAVRFAGRAAIMWVVLTHPRDDFVEPTLPIRCLLLLRRLRDQCWRLYRFCAGSA